MTAPKKRGAKTSRKKTAPKAATPSASALTPKRIAALVAVLVALVASLSLFRYLRSRHRGTGRSVRIVVADGDGARAITRALWDAHALDHPWLFEPLVYLTGAASRAHRGTIALRDDLSPWAILRMLRAGQAGLLRVTIPEGFTRFDIARRLEANAICTAQDFLAATEDPRLLARYGIVPEAQSVEGYLFPDTYDLPPESRAPAIVERMVAVFERRASALQARHPDAIARASALVPTRWRTAMPAAGPLSLELQALVSLASLVERETGDPRDRTHVSAVFWNRLTDPSFVPRLLQSDPTLRYGCLVRQRHSEPLGPCADADGTLRRTPSGTMLADATNPWNSYHHEHLPPSPIANPGAASLSAAFSPLPSADLYFVADAAGRSTFAQTLEQHRQNVAAWRLRSTRDAGAADAIR